MADHILDPDPTADPTADLTKEIAAFDEDGAVALRGIVSPSDLSRLEAAVEDDIRNPGPFFHGYASDNSDNSGFGQFHGNLRLWENHPVFRDFCLNSNLPRIAHAFFGGGRTNLLYDQLFVKESAMNQRTRWHNDQPYWPVRGWQVLSIWIALDKTTAENGRVEFVRGSHRWDRWFQPEVFGKTTANAGYERNPDFEDIPDIEANREDYEIISWDLEPGDVYVFHGMTVHGAGGNQSTGRRRRGYTIRYTGEDVRYDLRPGLSQPLICDELATGDRLDSPRFPVAITDRTATTDQ